MMITPMETIDKKSPLIPENEAPIGILYVVIFQHLYFDLYALPKPKLQVQPNLVKISKAKILDILILIYLLLWDNIEGFLTSLLYRFCWGCSSSGWDSPMLTFFSFLNLLTAITRLAIIRKVKVLLPGLLSWFSFDDGLLSWDHFSFFKNFRMNVFFNLHLNKSVYLYLEGFFSSFSFSIAAFACLLTSNYL